MAKLLFFDTNHTYTLDGEPIPSVSELTRFISREVYGDVQQFHLDRAADRGSAVHKAIEVLNKYGSVEATDDVVPFIKAYIAFTKDHPCEWEKIEWAVCSPDKDYAGTLDYYGTVDGKKTIVDVKTTANISPAHRKLYEAGQNLYRMAIEATHPVEQILILQLRKDETYKLHPIPIDDALANACRSLHQALKKKRRTKKQKETPDNG